MRLKSLPSRARFAKNFKIPFLSHTKITVFTDITAERLFRLDLLPRRLGIIIRYGPQVPRFTVLRRPARWWPLARATSYRRPALAGGLCC